MADRVELCVVDPKAERVDLIDCLEYTLINNGFTTGYRLGVKAYSNLPHGQKQEAIEDYIGIQDLRKGVGEFRRKIAQLVHWAAWSTALSSVLVDDGKVPKWFIPSVDLEIDATDDLEKDLGRVDYQLSSIGITGTFLKSGDTGSGSYFFVADEVKAYDQEFRKFFGLVMISLLDFQDPSEQSKGNWRRSLLLGDMLLSAKCKEEDRMVAELIKYFFPSVSSGQRRPGLKFDPRWVANRLPEANTYLRYTPGKGYEDRPLAVAGLY